ncbi:YqzE family protein [Virgibacillus kekensis]|uniref:YqzE family protein n=1 Tax=Virgibacillus kekensis TaxID=202261 RepID=A0ABV9DIX9_9BACI
MSGNDYIKYLTEQITTYIDTPAEEKKLKKSAHKHSMPGYTNRWLGVLPLALKMFIKKAN